MQNLICLGYGRGRSTLLTRCMEMRRGRRWTWTMRREISLWLFLCRGASLSMHALRVPPSRALRTSSQRCLTYTEASKWTQKSCLQHQSDLHSKWQRGLLSLLPLQLSHLHRGLKYIREACLRVCCRTWRRRGGRSMRWIEWRTRSMQAVKVMTSSRRGQRIKRYGRQRVSTGPTTREAKRAELSSVSSQPKTGALSSSLVRLLYLWKPVLQLSVQPMWLRTSLLSLDALRPAYIPPLRRARALPLSCPTTATCCPQGTSRPYLPLLAPVGRQTDGEPTLQDCLTTNPMPSNPSDLIQDLVCKDRTENGRHVVSSVLIVKLL